MKKNNRKKLSGCIIKWILAILVILAVICSLMWTSKSFFSHFFRNSTVEVHFIDVGQADATLVVCDGKAMLIDGGNPEDSDLLYSYLKSMVSVI